MLGGPSSANLHSLDPDPEEDKNESTGTGGVAEILSKQFHLVQSIDPVDRMQPEMFTAGRYAYMAPGFRVEDTPVVEWRMKDRMRTVSVALVACLNIGVDPPDVVKPQPCAKLECWEDPLGMPPQKALDTIGNTLQSQYERWQPRARYKVSLDPTLEDVRKLCLSLRRAAKEERVLFHYNGHGVPRPTANGEIWVFNKNYTQYIPLSLFDVQSWMGTPSVYVFDCSAAALVIDSFNQYEAQFRDKRTGLIDQAHESILLVPCGSSELLPMNPEFPADLFTSCITTPIKTSLRWFSSRSVLTHLAMDSIDKIPGRLNDRKTPLGEINWIFTAITDTIAWSVLPRDLFQKLFRQDLLLASIFRNFLLAERILKSVNCNPVSKPKLPSTHQHPMWKAWDLAAEFCMCELDKYIRAGSTPAAEAAWERSTFYTEQLTAFQVWLQFGTALKPPPIQLPVVLQVLLSQVHRHRALILLSQFLDKGAWAVNQALSVGIFPYVLRLLQSPAPELKEVLILIWAKILALDQTCATELIKDQKEEYHKYFLTHLSLSAQPMLPLYQSMAAFILSVICNGHEEGKKAVLNANPFPIIRFHLLADDNQVRLWMCLLCAVLWQNYEEAKMAAIREGIMDKLKLLLRDSVPEVRAAACHSMGKFVAHSSANTIISDASDQSNEPMLPPAAPRSQRSKFSLSPTLVSDELSSIQLGLARSCLKLAGDGSVLVRFELQIALQSMVSLQREEFAQLVSEQADDDGKGWDLATTPATEVGANIDEKLETTVNTLRDNSFRVRIWKAILSAKRDSFPIVSQVASNTCRLIEYIQKRMINGGDVHVNDVASASSVSRNRTASVEISLNTKSGSPHKASMQAQHFNRHKLPPEIKQLGVDPTSIARPTHYLSVDGSLNNRIVYSGQTASPNSSYRRNGSLVSNPNQSPRDTAQRLRVEDGMIGWKPSVSQFYEWCCSFFNEPLLSPSLDEGDCFSNNLETISSLSLTNRPVSQSFVENQKKIWRFQRNIASRQHAITLPQHFASNPMATSKPAFTFDDQIAIFQTEFHATSCLFFHPYEPILFAADAKDRIGLWNYEDGSKIHVFSNCNPPGTRMNTLALVNDLHISLLLTGADDGVVRLWKSPHVENGNELITSFVGLANRYQKSQMQFDWQQSTCRLVAGGNSEFIRLWDLEREQCISEILVTPPMAAAALQTAIENRLTVQAPVSRLISPSLGPQISNSLTSPPAFSLPGSEGNPTQRSSFKSDGLQSNSLLSVTDKNRALGPIVLSLCSAADGNLFVAGCSDGTVRIFDVRCAQPLISALAEHRTSVIKVHLQRGAENGGLLVSGGSSGDVVHADLRNLSESIVRIAAHSNSELNALAVHEYAPIIASGSHKQFIKIFNTEGDPISMIRHHDGFLGQRIGPVSALSFHKHKLLLAAGALDSYISIYAGN